MKNFISGLMGCVIAASAIAQEDYTIKVSVKAEGLPPEFAAYAEQDIVTYVKGERTRTDVNSMMYTSTVWYDGKVMTSINERAGNKSGFTATKDELEADKSAKQKPKIEYVDEKQTVAGYECGKAIVTTTDKDNKEKKMTVWYTDKIHINPTHRSGSGRGMTDLSELKGHPMAMEMSQDFQGGEMKLKITTTEVQTSPVDESLFKVNTDGYKMMTYKEAKDFMKGQGKGQ